MHWITTPDNGSLVRSIQRSDENDTMNGCAVMYDIGMILTFGGAVNYSSGPTSNRADVIDINGSESHRPENWQHAVYSFSRQQRGAGKRRGGRDWRTNFGATFFRTATPF
jgi:hypothetical protein